MTDYPIARLASELGLMQPLCGTQEYVLKIQYDALHAELEEVRRQRDELEEILMSLYHLRRDKER